MILSPAEKTRDILEILKQRYPLTVCTLEFEDAFELLVCARLAAQCTDARVNTVTPALFKKYPTVHDFAEADPDEVAQIIRSCGFYRAKARDIVAAARMLLENYGGRLPDSVEELIKLPGVGRKIANLIVGDVFGKPAVVADTHCIRISNRLGLADSRDPLKVERALRALLPPEESSDFCHRLVFFGREVCRARAPRCGECPLAGYCGEVATRGV